MNHEEITQYIEQSNWNSLRELIIKDGVDFLKEHENIALVATRMKQLYCYDDVLIKLIEGIETVIPEKDGTTLLKELAEKHEMGDDLKNYLFNGVTSPSYSSFYDWDNLIREMVAGGIALDDDAIKMICKIISELGYGSSYFFRALKHNQPDLEESYSFLYQLFIDAGADMVKVSYNFFDQYSSDKILFMPNIQCYLLPHFETEVENMAGEYGIKGYFALRLLIQEDYEGYKTIITQYLSRRDPEHRHDLYTIIPDDELIKNKIRDELIHFVDMTAKPASLKTKLIPAIENYYDCGEEADKFEDLLIKYRKKFSKYSTKFYDAMLSGGVADLTKVHYQRLYQLCLKIDPANTLKDGFQIDEKFDDDQITVYFENFKDVIPEVAVYLAGNLDRYAYRETYQRYLKVLNSIDSEKTRKGLEGDNKVLAVALPYIVEPIEENYDYLLSLAKKGPTNAVRDLLARVLKGYEAGFEDFKALLKGKKQAVRGAGVALLGTFIDRETEVVTIFKAHQQSETASDPLSLITQYFNRIAQEAKKRRLNVLKTFESVDFEREAQEHSDKMAESLKKATWVKWDQFPELHWRSDKKALSKDAVAYLFGHMIDIGKYDYDTQTLRFISLICDEDLTSSGAYLYEAWSFQEKNSWFFPLLIKSSSKVLADQLVDLYRANIDGEMGNSAYTPTREDILRAIGSFGSYSGFRLLNRVAYMGKKDRYAASKALREGCRKLNLDSGVQSDFLVPDFGFSPEGVLELDYGKRQFTIKIMSDYTYQVHNQAGRSYKNLPKPGKTDNPELSKAASEFFKQVKEDLRNQVKYQKKRLEAAMIEQRNWSRDDWKFIFMDHPVFRPLATTLIWGIYVDDQLVNSFRATQEGELSDVDDEPFELPETGEIRLIHRLLIDDQLLEGWQEQLEDYELSQPFFQLDRPIFTLNDDQKELTEISDFLGHIVFRIALRSKMEQFGWSRGPVEDAGMIYTYYKYQNGYEITLNYHGEYVGYGDRMAPTALKSFSFYNQELKKIVTLKEVSAILYSETYRIVKAIADGGTGYSEDWESIGY